MISVGVGPEGAQLALAMAAAVSRESGMAGRYDAARKVCASPTPLCTHAFMHPRSPKPPLTIIAPPLPHKKRCT